MEKNKNGDDDVAKEEEEMWPQAMLGLFYLYPYAFNVKILFARMHCSGDPRINTSLSFLPPSRSVSIVDLCNGLLLCSLDEKDEDDVFSDYHVVCNPTSSRWDRIPKPEEDVKGMVLGFDPHISTDYTVLGFYQSKHGSSQYKIKFFFSESTLWEDGTNIVPSNAVDNLHKSVYFQGIFHILNITPSGTDIIGINRHGELCQIIELPRQVSYDKLAYSEFIGLSGGRRLHYAFKSTEELAIWAMDDYDSKEWIIKHKISSKSIVEKLQPLQLYFDTNMLHKPTFSGGLDPVPSQTSTLFSDLQIVAFHPEDDAFFFTLEGAVLSYQFSKSTFTVVSLMRGKSIDKVFVYSPCYSEDFLMQRGGEF